LLDEQAFEEPVTRRDRPAGMHTLVLAAAIVFVLGCSTTPTSPPFTGNVPVGCLGLDDADCQQVGSQALERLGADPSSVSYVIVGPMGCFEPCESGTVRGGLTVEFVDGRRSAGFQFEVGPQGLALRAMESTGSMVEPSSGRLANNVLEMTLGHCGLYSGIDVDGSFWDPVGLIDASHPDSVNAATGTFTLTSATSAVLRTQGGLQLELVRHRGPKTLPGCD
jgi:hypothetical protein